LQSAAASGRKLRQVWIDGVMSLRKKLSYARKVWPAATMAGLRSAVSGPVHLIFAMADHFEPAIDPTDGYKRVSRQEQLRRLEAWTTDYPKAVERWRDHDGRPFAHTYFYPAEQYDEELVSMLAEHCHAGWGEIEVHLHHGMHQPDTAENTRRALAEFRDRLALHHGCLSAETNSRQPRYAFVHGNFALANSAAGRFCGVNSEMQILAETGCYADFTLPSGFWHPAQTAKLNSVYECALPLNQWAPHRQGRDLAVGVTPSIFPIMVQGPLVMDTTRSLRRAVPVLENGAVTGSMPMTMPRLPFWKRAHVHVSGRPDWIFIKLHCHGMDPTQHDSVLGDTFHKFLEELVAGAEARKETLHFVTARELVNILLAACDGREGNPNDYRDYRLKRFAQAPANEHSISLTVNAKG
jgi:hypothetical protein